MTIINYFNKIAAIVQLWSNKYLAVSLRAGLSVASPRRSCLAPVGFPLQSLTDKPFHNLYSTIVILLLLSCSSERLAENNFNKTVPVISNKKVSIKDTSEAKLSNCDSPFRTKVLKLLITNNFNTYFIFKGEELGLEYELLKLYVKEKGWTIKLQHVHDIEHIKDSLIHYRAHIAAASFTIPPKAQDSILFSDPLYKTQLVLVRNTRSKGYTEDPENKKEHTAFVIKSAPYVESIWNDTIDAPGNLHYKYAHAHATEELLIEEVAEGKIESTISGRQEALILQGMYPFLDISQVLKKNVPVAFIFNPAAEELKKDFDGWLFRNRKLSDYQWTLLKYEKWPQKIRHSLSYALPALTEGKVSVYDRAVKQHAADIEWDWKLLSALIYQESRFDSLKISGAGAMGLMQIMPKVGLAYASTHPKELFKPIKNIIAGTKYLNWIKKNFYNEPNISEEDKIKFILASYNAGPGHVQDARALAKKHGLNPDVWEGNTEKMMLAKSHPSFFRDPLSKHGYCRGKETVIYVKNILNYFQHYSNFYPEDEMARKLVD